MLGKVHLMLFSLVVGTGLLSVPAKQLTAASEDVQITDKGNHFLVTIDASSASHSAIGSELGSRIPTAVPDLESLVDSYIAEGTESDVIYDLVLSRMIDIRSWAPMEYQDEVDAMSAALNLGIPDARGDGRLKVTFHLKTGSPTSNPMFDLVCEGLPLRQDMPWIPLLRLGD